MILFTFFLSIASIFLFTKLIIKNAGLGTRITVSFLFSSVFFAVNPSIFFYLYYNTASYVYAYPISIFLVNIFIFHHYSVQSGWKQYSLFITLSFFLFFGIGFNEMFLVLYFLLALLLTFYPVKQLSFHSRFPIALMIYISIIFFILSPGVLSRNQVHDFHFTTIIYHALMNYIIAIKTFVLSPYLVLLFLVSYFFYKELVFSNKFKIGITIASFLVPLLMTLPYFITRNDTFYMEDRIYIHVFFFQLLMLFFFIFPFVWQFFEKYQTRLKFNLIIPSLTAVSGILFLVSIFYYKTNEIGIVFSDLKSNKIQKFYEYNTTMYHQLILASESPNPNKILCFDAFDAYPENMHQDIHHQLNRHETLWNVSLEAYFNVDEVRIKEAGIYKYSIE